MNDSELIRYSKQIFLKQVGVEGQERLSESCVMIVGLGGLGSVSSMYLAGSGIGHLVLVDFDKVELSNLHRQIVHGEADQGRLKIESARDALLKLNSGIKTTLVKSLREAEESGVLEKVDVMVDGTDNLQTRLKINGLCVEHKIPLISASANQFDGQICIFEGYMENEPCYECVYGGLGEVSQGCVENGILGPMVGMVGSIQALECIKIIVGVEGLGNGRMLVIDGNKLDFQKIKISKRSDCGGCC